MAKTRSIALLCTLAGVLVFLLVSCGGGGGGGGQVYSLTLNGTSNTSSTVDLNWSDLSVIQGVIAVKVYRANAGAGFEEVHSPGISATSWTDTGRAPFTLYDYYLSVIYDTGTQREARSSVVQVRTKAITNNPPSSISAAYIATNNTIRVIWQDNSETETGFQVEKAVDGGPSTLVPVVGANLTSYIETNVVAGSTYYFRVRAALPSGGFTLPSGTIELHVTAGQLSAPTNLRASLPSSSSVQLSWTDNSSNESGFEVQRAVTGSSGFISIQTLAAGATGVVDAGLAGGSSYTYRVRAVATGRVSQFTNLVSVAVGTSALPAPTNLRSAALNSATLRLFWDDNASSESGYEIERVFPSVEPVATVGSNVTIQDISVATATGFCSDAAHERFDSIYSLDLDFSRMSLSLSGGSYVISSGSATFESSYTSVLGLYDEDVISVNLPFSLPYPGGTTTAVNVSDNGFITVGTPYQSYTPTSSLFQSWPTVMWAPCWHDFFPDSSNAMGGVTINSTSSRVVITWNGVRSYGSPATSTFQIQLRPNGQVDYVWQSMGSGSGGTPSAALVGFRPPGVVTNAGFRDLSATIATGFLLCGATTSGTTVLPNATYGVRVRASGGGVFSGYSSPTYFRMPDTVAPTNLTVSQSGGAGSGSLLLTWADNWNLESGFVLEHSSDGSYFTPLQSFLGNTVVAGAQASFMRRTWFRVAATRADGLGGKTSYSNVVSIIPQ